MIHFYEMLYKMMKNVYGQPYQRNLKLFYCELNTIKQIRKRINEYNNVLKVFSTLTLEIFRGRASGD